jgi:ribonucleoside-triphosphate reductase
MDRIRVIGGILNAEEEKASFKRIRRITGYLVGDLSRFNNAKLSEVNDRVKHGAGD